MFLQTVLVTENMQKIVSYLKDWFGYIKSWFFAQSNAMQTSMICGVGLLFASKLYNIYQNSRTEFPINKSSLESKIVFITGCSSGIGKALAHQLNEYGFTVIASCRRQESLNEYKTNSKFTSNGSIVIQLDVTNKDSIANARKEIETYLNNNKNKVLWGIINNAGICKFGLFEFLNSNDISRQVDINLTGPMDICKTFIPLLFGRMNKINGYKRANGGRIVNIGSAAATVPLPGIGVYCASKAGISMFSSVIRCQLSPRFGIWSTVFEIPAFKTNINEDVIGEFDKAFNNATGNNDITKSYDINAEREMQKKGDMAAIEGLDSIVNDVIHALTAKYPKKNYQTGTGNDLKTLRYLVNNYYTMERLIFGSYPAKYYY